MRSQLKLQNSDVESVSKEQSSKEISESNNKQRNSEENSKSRNVNNGNNDKFGGADGGNQ